MGRGTGSPDTPFLAVLNAKTFCLKQTLPVKAFITVPQGKTKGTWGSYTASKNTKVFADISSSLKFFL